METYKKPKATNEQPEPNDGLTQSERFIKAARELECDDDPERFKDRVRKVAKAASQSTLKAGG